MADKPSKEFVIVLEDKRQVFFEDEQYMLWWIDRNRILDGSPVRIILESKIEGSTND